MAWTLLDNQTLADGLTSSSVKVTNAYLHTVQLTFTESAGTVTAMTIDIEGSLDDTNFFAIASHDLTAAELADTQGSTVTGSAMFHIVNRQVRYVRAKVASVTGEGAGDTITLKYQDYDEGLR